MPSSRILQSCHASWYYNVWLANLSPADGAVHCLQKFLVNSMMRAAVWSYQGLMASWPEGSTLSHIWEDTKIRLNKESMFTQGRGEDCGLFAIASNLELLGGGDPASSWVHGQRDLLTQWSNYEFHKMCRSCQPLHIVETFCHTIIDNTPNLQNLW